MEIKYWIKSKVKKNIMKLKTPICHILMYHQITRPKIQIGPYRSNAVSEENFEAHMAYLANNYNVIALDEFIDALNKGIKLPKNSVVITFDDGFKDNYTVALPILEKYNLPATIYIATSLIGNTISPYEYVIAKLVNDYSHICFNYRGNEYGYNCKGLENKEHTYQEMRTLLQDISTEDRLSVFQQLTEKKEDLVFENLFMTWEEVKKISENRLITIGGHTHSHRFLTSLRKENIFNEIKMSCDMLRENIGEDIRHFTYPYGAVNDDVLSIAKQFNFKSALTTRNRFVTVDNSKDVYYIPRVEVPDDRDISKILYS